MLADNPHVIYPLDLARENRSHFGATRKQKTRVRYLEEAKSETLQALNYGTPPRKNFFLPKKTPKWS